MQVFSKEFQANKMFFKLTLLALFAVAFAAQAAKDGKVSIGGREYFISTEELTWTKSSEKCHEMGMKMLAVETSTENSAIFDYLEDNGLISRSLWTGGKELNDTYSTDGNWTWVDLDKPIIYNQWTEDRPNPFARGFCNYLSNWNRYWFDGDCGSVYRYICEVY